MNVTRSGPRGYEHQYAVSAWLALHLLKRESLVVEIESAGSEDATFRLGSSPQTVLEVQVKSQTQDVSAGDLGTWLAHFPEGEVTGCLFERLLADPERRALFVVTARCRDALAAITIREPDLLLDRKVDEAPTLSREDAHFVRDALAEAWNDKPTDLRTKRHKRCQAIVAAHGIDAFRNMLKRVALVERLDEREVIENSTRILVTHRISRRQAATVFAHDLIADVKKARDSRADLIPQLQSTLRRFRAERVFTARIDIPLESTASLADELRRERVLLLTGMSKCGKTHAAKRTVQQLQDEGADVRVTNDVLVAARFFDGSAGDDRVALLEDPFDQPERREQSVVADRLRRLIEDMPPECRLIVTSRRDSLPPIVRSSPSGATFLGAPWRDLTLVRRVDAETIWAECSAQVDDRRRAEVAAVLQGQRDAELLQPGHLQRLAAELRRDAGDRDVDALMRLARAEAAALGQLLCAQGPAMVSVLVALRTTATTIDAVDAADLAFVLSASDDQPAVTGAESERLDALLDESVEGNAPGSVPTYGSVFQFTDSDAGALDELENRQLIERVEGRYRFTHPSYMQASEIAFDSLPANAFERTLRDVRRALYCLSPRSAVNASRTLRWLWSLSSQGDRQRAIEGVAADALGVSIFPGVRDGLLSWFWSVRQSVEFARTDAFRKLHETTWALRGSVRWHDDQPWYDTRVRRPSRDKSWVRDYLKLTPDPVIDAAAARTKKQLWELVEWSRRSRVNRLPAEIVREAIFQDEYVLRVPATYLAARDHLANAQVFRAVLSEASPEVFAEGVKGLLKGWRAYDREVSARALSAIETALADPDRASLAIDVLAPSAESDDYESRWDEDQLWECWVRLVGASFRALRPKDRVRTHHLAFHLENAGRRVTGPQLVDAIGAWMDWIDKVVAERWTSGDEVAPLDYLFCPSVSAAMRRPLLDRALQHSNTLIHLWAVSKMLSQWEELDTGERGELAAVLGGGRLDRRWSRAVALTGKDVPEAIVSAVLGDPHALDRPADALQSLLSEELLGDCLAIYVREPSQLASVGYSARADRPWRMLLLVIAREPNHRLFAFAIRALLDEYPIAEDTVALWADLCSKCSPQLADALFDQLLRRSVAWVGSHAVQLWTILLKSPHSDALGDKWRTRVLERIEKITGNDNLNELLADRDFFEALMQRLPGDRLYWEVYRAAKQVPGATASPAFHDLVRQIYLSSPPRLLRTHDLVLADLGAATDPKDAHGQLVAAVLKARSRVFAAEHSERWAETPEPPLPNWTQDLADPTS